MKRGLALIFFAFFINCLILSAQKADSVTLQIKTTESDELRDYYRFEGIDYYTIQLTGQGIAKQYFILSSAEYWGGELTRLDTIANTKISQIRNNSDTISFRMMSKKIVSDTAKFKFYLPRFSTARSFKTINKNIYSLRDITTNGTGTFSSSEPINLMVYSLPYENPEYPGYLFYCELSREGIPPEQWWQEFGVNHYVIFKLQLIE